MPVNHLGYRQWSGRLTGSISRWRAITRSGITLAQKSSWVRRLLFAAWLPVLYWGVGFFFIGQAMDGNNTFVGKIDQQTIEQFPEFVQDRIKAEPNMVTRIAVAGLLQQYFRKIPNASQVANDLIEGDESTGRNRIWCWLLMSFFRYPQGMMILFLVGTITPSLISRDIRSKAFLLYFSRPIGKLEYLLGKFFIPATFIFLVTTLPAITLYIFGILMSPDLSVFWSTWDVPLRIFAGTAVLVLPTCSVALMFSSLTQESRFASFSWFAFWTLGHAAWLAVVFSRAARLGQLLPFDPSVMSDPAVRRWGLVSIYNNLGEVQGWIFGFASFDEVKISLAVLAGITLFSLAVIYRQIASPLRV